MRSGRSILGALEYNSADDTMRCHECGEWTGGLGAHIKKHKLSRVAYNRRHGLSAKTPLSSFRTRKLHRVQYVQRTKRGEGIAPHALAVLSDARKQRQVQRLGPRPVEMQNARGRCAAQLLFRIQFLAALSHHTPTVVDLRDAGIYHAVVQRFGSLDQAMYIAGLEPNTEGHTANPTPRGFPSKREIQKRFNERMPWPDWYATVKPFEQKRA